MSLAVSQQPNALPLTTLTDDEILFRDNIRQFAEEKIRPKVKEMDEQGVFNPSLIEEFFQLGIMGIEIPEQYGGGGGEFFEAILAVEELSRVDASAGVIVDVQNTLVNNALVRWGSEEQRKHYLPRMATNTCGAYALSEATSGSDAFALQSKAELKGSQYILNGRKLWITNGKEAGLFVLFATVDASAGYKGITAFIVEKDFTGFTVGKKEDKLGIRASSTCELLLEDCRVPRENVLGDVGKGYKIAIETLNEGRIGIGAQMVGIARGAWEYAARYVEERKQFGKKLSRFSRYTVSDRANGYRHRGRPPDGLQRSQNEGCRHVIRQRSSHGEVIQFSGGRARDVARHRNIRRIRVHQRLSRREILARCENWEDLRRYVEHAIGNHCQARSRR